MLGGIGYLLGPSLGSGMNFLLGYAGPIYIIAGAMFILFIWLRAKLPITNNNGS